MNTSLTPLSLDQVADHLERMLLRYEELQKSNALLQAQLLEVTQERDALRSRLASARARVDTLLARMPAADTAPASPGHAHHHHPHAQAGTVGSSGAAAGTPIARGANAAGGTSAGAAPASPAGATSSRGPQQAAIAPASLLAALTARSAQPEPGAAPSSAWGEENT